MHLKQKIYYISIGVILLAVFQVGIQLIPRLAFADSHGVHEAEGTITETVLKAYELFEQQNMKELEELFSSDIVFVVNGNMSWSGTFNGFDDMLENCFSKLGTSIPDFKNNILQTWEIENTAFLRIDQTSKKFDKALPALHMMEINSDGKITFFQAFDDTHGLGVADASKPKPTKTSYLVRFTPKEGMLKEQITQFASVDMEAQDQWAESVGVTLTSYHASDMSGVVIVEADSLDLVTLFTLPWRATYDMDIDPTMSREEMQETCKKVSTMMLQN